MSSSARSFFRLGYRTKSVIILLLMACGPQPFDYDEFKSFFMPESARNEAAFHPYNFTPQFLYDDSDWYADSPTDPAEAANTKAWANYAGIEDSIVTEELYPRYGSKTTTGLSQALKEKGNLHALQYLEFSKKIAVADGPTEAGGTGTKPDFEAWLNLIKSEYNQSTDAFIKERLAYQAVKVADMAGKPQQSIDFYNSLVKSLPTKTFISDWACARMAGAYVHAGDSTQAYYQFSQIFVNAPTRRKEAYLSLRTYLPKLKDEALKLCKTDAERANIYAATAVLPFQDGLPMMEQIRDLNANSPLLEFVMAREINKNEDFFFNTREDLKYAYWNLDSLKKANLKTDAPGYFNKLLNFSLESAENPSLKTSPFWYTSAAYLTFIARDYKKAADLLQKAKAIPTTNKALQDQIAMQELTLLVSETEHITPEIESKLMPLLERFSNSRNFRVANNFNAACRILVAKYRGQPVTDEFTEAIGRKMEAAVSKSKENKTLGWLSGCFGKKNKEFIPSSESTAKAFLLSMLTSSQLGYSKQTDGNTLTAYFMSNADQYAIEDSTSSATIYGVISYFSSKNQNDFDKRLIKLTGLTNDYLYTVLGRRALAEHQYTKAAEAWQHISPATWQAEPFKTYLDVNPFHLDGQGDTNPKQRVTPLSFALRMAELQEKVSKNPADYQSWLLLGCGSYNMSYFGNSWILQRRGWSGGEQRNEQDDYYTSAKALAYFDKAMQTASTAEDAAKACYLAAACQKIRYELVYTALYDGLYLLPDDERTRKEKEINKTLENLRREKYATYFNLLKTKYQSTNYASQLIDECSTYKDFLTGK
ncbi:hypothetical protein [Emticicia fluvialis]|uniref:hypothetical protein n=1 Tax=Emticicia fluvialis TaxID=2974474 RepID=UPI00216597E0|nr:hypothetical protein [Emticicia fluvialis]